jgi:hypothetical protein
MDAPCTLCSAGANWLLSRERLPHHRHKGPVLTRQPRRGHQLDRDQPGIFGIILGVEESLVSTPLLDHAPHSWRARRPSGRSVMGT